MIRILSLTVIILFGSIIYARPTSNVINAVYSLQDDFFEAYGFPSLSFENRVTICESPYSKVTFNNDSISVNAELLYNKKTIRLSTQSMGADRVDYLYFQLIKDKKKKRHLLFVFHQVDAGYEMRLKRLDVLQYEKKGEKEWVALNAGEVIPRLTWRDFYSDISDDALDQTFTMRLVVRVELNPKENIFVTIANDYIEKELPEVQKYLNENPMDVQNLILKWNKKESKFMVVEE